MAEYNYDNGGFPSSPAVGDRLTIGSAVYIWTDKGSWDAHAGAAGPQGAQGLDGLDNYQLAVNAGLFTGTVADYLASLEGADGAAGADGADGVDGTDGLTAYEVAVNNGYAGTEAEYVADSLDHGGQEFTGGFTDRLIGQTGASDFGTSVAYTQAQATAGTWRRFGIDATARDANDSPYWTGAAPTQGKGLFGGTQMPYGVTNMFDFTDTSIAAAVTSGANPYTAANGSLDWTECKVGDQAIIRFDFNVIPQVANTTVEVGLIFATRDADDNVTFTFPLTTTPLFYGTGSVGNTYLNRPQMTAYFASSEDINARALPAIRADNPVLIQPLTMLTTIIR